MFGEKPIVGQTIIRIKKNRIVLPDFTGIEPGEKLSSTIDLRQKKIMIMQEKDLLSRLDMLNKEIELRRENGTISYRTYKNLQSYIWGVLCLHERKINKKKEYMLFSQKYEDIPEQRQIRKLNFKGEVFAVGVEKHLEIYPSEEAYHDYLVFQEEQKRKLTKESK